MTGGAPGVAFALVATLLAAGAPRAPEPCTDCHVGIEADSASFQGLTFRHARHVTLEGACVRCHVDHLATGADPGVTVAKGDCAACHHGEARRGTALCEACHEPIFAESVTFQGRPFNHSVHVGSFTGLGCADCHGASDEPVVASPPMSVCVACHP